MSESEVQVETKPTESRRFSKLRIPFAFIILMTLLSGVVHGIIDGRWSTTEDLVLKGDQLQEIPNKCGDWTLLRTKKLEASANDLLRCYGSEVREYRHNLNGVSITVAILFGPRGPIAVHTPEVCYSSLGTSPVDKRKVETIRSAGKKHQLWSIQFRENASPDPSLDVWYGWSDGNEWVASKNPRFWMTDNLYKIQIAGPVGEANFKPCEDFLIHFLPQVEPLIQ